MGALVPMRHGGLTRNDPKRLTLFKNTVGKDLVGTEIDEAIEWCELYGANPFVKDIYFFVFEGPRRVVPVLGIGLYRKIAARTGNYRPDSAPPRFTYDESLKGPDNPAGIVDCELSVYQHSHGEWHQVTSRLRWIERAPIVEGGTEGFEWEDTGQVHPPGHKNAGKPKFRKVPKGNVVATLDPRKPNWRTMPETMLAKCVEADAIRKAWPNETTGSYVAEELDRGDVIELTATEIIAKEQTEQDLRSIGGSDALIVDWLDGKALARVPLTEFWDASLRWMAEKDRSETEIRVWFDRNKYARGEAKAKAGSHYLDWMKAVENRVAEIKAAEQKDAAE